MIVEEQERYNKKKGQMKTTIFGNRSRKLGMKYKKRKTLSERMKNRELKRRGRPL